MYPIVLISICIREFRESGDRKVGRVETARGRQRDLGRVSRGGCAHLCPGGAGGIVPGSETRAPGALSRRLERPEVILPGRDLVIIA